MSRLIGVGVGPGDPELVTVKAVRVLREADVVLVPVLAAVPAASAEPASAEPRARSPEERRPSSAPTSPRTGSGGWSSR